MVARIKDSLYPPCQAVDSGFPWMPPPNPPLLKTTTTSPPSALFGEMHDNGVGVGQVGRVFAGGLDVLHQFFRVQALSCPRRVAPAAPPTLGNDDTVGQPERGGEVALENISARGIAARFEHRPDFFARKFEAQGFERHANGGRMMPEIHRLRRYAAGECRAPSMRRFTPRNGIEKRGLDLLVREPEMFRARRDGQRVADVEFAHQDRCGTLKPGFQIRSPWARDSN